MKANATKSLLAVFVASVFAMMAAGCASVPSASQFEMPVDGGTGSE